MADPYLYELLTQGGGAPFPGSQPFPGPAFPGLGFTGGGQPTGPLSAALQMVVPFLAESMRSQLGMAGFTFGGQRSLFDAAESRDYLLRLQQARTEAAPGDVERLGTILRGTSRVFGGDPFAQDDQGRRLSAAIDRMAERGGQILPFLAAAAPDLTDQAFGVTGSRTVAAQNFVLAGRYLAGPTGRVGEVDPGQLATATLDRLYGTGRGDDPFTVERTAGLGAGRISAAFDELTRRGAIGVGGGSVEAMGQRAAAQLEQYAGAIAVVRDIFGDAGRPDAPMADLIKGLETISRGQLGAMDPARLTSLAAQFRVATRLSPLGYEGQLRAQSLGGALGDQFGVMPALTADSWRVAALAARGFQEFAGAPSPEFLTQQQFTDEAVRLRTAGQASPFANAAGAVLGLADFVDPQSRLGRLASAIRRGRTSVAVGDQVLDITRLQTYELDELAREAGLSPGALQARLELRQVNQARLAQEPNFDRVLREGQREELRGNLTRALGFRGLGDPARVAEVVERELQNPENRTIDQASRAAATALGLDRRRAADISQAVGEAGLLSGGDLELFRRTRVVGERAGRAGDALDRQIREREDELLRTQGLGRGTLGQNLTEYLALLGSPQRQDALGAVIGAAGVPRATGVDPSILDAASRLLGGVSVQEVERARGRDPLGSGAAAKVEITNPELTVRIVDADGQLRASGTAAFGGFRGRFAPGATTGGGAR